MPKEGVARGGRAGGLPEWLVERMRKNPVCMMVTTAATGPRARPMTAVRLTGKRTLLFVSSTNSRKLADIQGNKGGCLTFAGDGWWACVTGEFSIRALSDSEIAAFACDWETPGEEVVGLEFAVRAVEAWGAVGGPRELGLDPAASTEENSENIRRIR